MYTNTYTKYTYHTTNFLATTQYRTQYTNYYT